MKTVKIFAILALFAAFSTKALCQDYKEVDGLKYKIFNPHKGPKPHMGDKAVSDMIVYDDNNTLLFNSIEKHQLIPIPIMKSQFKGDIIEGVQLMSVGDSAEFLISSDSIIKIAKAAGQASSLKPGSHMRYILVLRSIFNDSVQAEIDDKIIKDYIKANKIEGMKRTADGLYYKITQEGTGDLPKAEQNITAHYTGKFLDGKVFDSDANRPGPGLEFPLGMHRVISGWDEAFGLMKKGSKATLLIPSKLAYGPSGNPPVIAPNAVLMFDVELVDITSAVDMKQQALKDQQQAATDETIIQNYIKANKIEGMQRTYDGLYYKITTEGTGPAAQPGQGITAHYTGKFLDGKVFDSDANRTGPGLKFTLGQHAVIEGWDEAFGLMRKGSKATLIIPSKLAYGPNANGPIPANSVLMFDVELVDITPAK